MDIPTRDHAAAALAELEAGRQAVVTAETRGLPVLLTSSSALVLADYAAKDFLRDRRAKRVVTVVCQFLALGIGLRHLNDTPVQPVSVDKADLGPRAAAPLLAALTGWILAERVLVVGLRRSALGWPNTVAGIALALGRPAAYIAVQRLLPRPGRDRG